MAVSPSKTAQTALVSWTNGDLAAAGVYVGSALSVATLYECVVYARVAHRVNTANTAGYPKIRIEASALASGTYEWYPLTLRNANADVTAYTPAVGTSVAATTLNGAVSANASSFVVASATNIAIGDTLFLGHSSAANYEVVRVKGVSGTTITPEENVTYAHASGAVVTDQAEQFTDPLNLRGVLRLRAVVDNSGNAVACIAQVLVVTEDSVG